MEKINIAIAGNPNSGKSSIFNALTGARQHIGNYPGVTVEKKEGSFKHNGYEIKVTDLPGTYSLTSRSLEERIARDYLLKERPDAILDILDSSNLERNLYLATQLMELNIPLILVLNMSDRAHGMGQKLDLNLFKELTNTVVIETVGHKKATVQKIKDEIIEIYKSPRLPHKVDYGSEIASAINRQIEILNEHPKKELQRYPLRWLAVKLIENDREMREKVMKVENADAILATAARLSNQIEKHFGDDPFTIFSEKRYGYISGLYHEVVLETPEEKIEFSERLDSIITHKILGIPIFLALMYLVFYLTFKLGEAPMGWIESFFDFLGSTISSHWPTEGQSPLKSLIVDGMIGGVGGVIVFLPNIVFLFLAIAILEDTGYMSRAAFIIDRLMHKIGLHGKSFIPMLIGFGCTVPAIMATRIIEDKKDRLTTMMVLPLMSCGARLPIYALIIPAFFSPLWRPRVLWLIYIIGIVLAILFTKALKKTLLKGKSAPFVMELPPYRMPTLRGLAAHISEKSYLYLKKAGTIILAISIIMWFLTSYPKPSYTPPVVEKGEGQIVLFERDTDEARLEELKYSVAGRVGKGLEKVLGPLGFDWKISTALIGAFAAKEVFVAQMGIIYAMGEEDTESLRQELKKTYSPLTGFCIMLFCLIATPCMATFAITKRESGRWKWALLQFIGLTVAAYIITLVVYQVGSIFI